MKDQTMQSGTVIRAFAETDQAVAGLIAGGRADKATALAVLAEFASRICRVHPGLAEGMKTTATERAKKP